MEVMPGYKQTDVGVIPENWDVESMLGISQKIMDYRGRTPRKLAMNWGGGEIPALSAGNVRKGFIDFSAECYFGSEELYQRWMTQGGTEKGDVLFTTEAPLGNVALVPDGRKYILSQRTILIRCAPGKALNEYTFQLLLSEKFQRILLDYSSGSTAKGIQRRRFEKLQIALPKLEEQREIATALSDMDALLDGLDRLIAKKRAIKQATMQQLLTGQTRLPGFSEEWEVKRLGDIASIEMGQSPDSRHYNRIGDGIPLIQGNADIENRLTIARVWTTQVTKEGFAGDLLLTVRAPVGAVGKISEGCCLGRGVCSVRPRVDADFLFHALIQSESAWQSLQQGSTFTSANSKQVAEFTLLIPIESQ